MEIICYSQIQKICYLITKNLLTNCIDKIMKLIIILSDNNLNKIMKKFNTKLDLDCVLLSGNYQLINEWLNTNNNNNIIEYDTLKQILLLDDIEIIKKF